MYNFKKILCKKEYRISESYTNMFIINSDYFNKGEYYKNFRIEINIEDNIDSTIFIYFNNSSHGLRFKINKNSNKYYYLPYFYDYFYTDIEIRKLKLNEIQNS